MSIVAVSEQLHHCGLLDQHFTRPYIVLYPAFHVTCIIGYMQFTVKLIEKPRRLSTDISEVSGIMLSDVNVGYRGVMRLQIFLLGAMPQ